jgi:pyocin large subunit-like protein
MFGKRNDWSATNESVGSREGQLARLRLVALFLVGLLGFTAAALWSAPKADARKKRARTPTTIIGETVSTTSVVGKSTETSKSTKSTKSVKASKSETTSKNNDKSGTVLVFPGSGKRANTPSTIATKPRPTLVASASPAGSGAKAKTASNSNRSDSRLRAIGFRSRTKLEQHYEKHGREFGNVTLDEYLSMAQDLRDAPLSNRVIEANQVGGTISRFDRQTGAFTAFDRDLTIRTFFKPNGGEDYFRRAATKTH